MNAKIATLRLRGVHLGTSSWKYEGWKGLVYNKPYPSHKAFQDQSLIEYAEQYPTVGVDHTYYAWPLPTTFQRYAEQTPPDFRFGLKVTEKITVFRYPRLKRYGKEAGSLNGSFLDATAFREEFLKPLAPIRDRLGPLMLEFSHFQPGMLASGREFVDKLDRFFTDLALSNEYQLAVEMRNANWLQEPYFEMLAKHRVAHVYNSWTKMPRLEEQLELTAKYPQPAYVARILLQPGTKYEEAVEAFSPYDHVQDLQPELRSAAALLVERALDAGVRAYVFVNNRAEGCAPRTIEGILEFLEKRKKI